MTRRMLVLNVAALSPWEVGSDCPRLSALGTMGSVRPLLAPEPALTSSSHATMLTGAMPRDHGIIANGWYDAQHAKIFNWNRSDRLVNGEKIWESAAKERPGFKTVNLFWRYCTHADCALTLTERPTYFANGRKGADVYSSSTAFRQACIDELGPFPFFHFWGPKANLRSSEWIVGAARKALREEAPDLLLCYAPGLDYEVQRVGPRAESARAVLRAGDAVFAPLIDEALAADMDVAVVSDYGFAEVDTPVFLNRALRRAGFLAVEPAANGELLEPGASRALAVCDNQAAHIYVRDPADLDAVKQCLEADPGVREVAGPEAGASPCLGHPRSGQLLAIAQPGHWFAYPYWLDEAKAPDFARCVDIFNKPGFDPCELFMRPGFGGALHVGKRFAQLKLNIRAPFDVIDPDAHRIRGSRNIRPQSNKDGAVLLSSWAIPGQGPVHMTELKSLLLARLGDREA